MTDIWAESRLSLKDAYDLYETGKHRRYSLMFAVEGGAFAVAKLLGPHPEVPTGGLSLTALAIGMAAFTAVMGIDIWWFGEKMRASYLPTAFGPWGKRVLVAICGLAIAGWLLVALG